MMRQDDRIFRSTRLVAVGVVPILLLAFVILYLFPEQTGSRFAWEIKPQMTAVYMGAGYFGGGWLFLQVILGRCWHRVAPGFLPVTSFTIVMLLTTLLHWDRFDVQHPPTILWLLLYLITPVLIPWLWGRNRVIDNGKPEWDDLIVPGVARWSLRLLGIFLSLFALTAFMIPTWLIGLWPWPLTLLTARVLCGWFVLLGVGGITIAQETRWSSWRIGLQSIGLWHGLVLLGALIHPEDFSEGLLTNWYLFTVLLVLVGMTILYVQMEIRRHKLKLITHKVN